MNMKDYFAAEVDKNLGKARSLVDNADREARSLTDEERQEYTTAIKSAEEYQAKLHEEQDKESMRKAIEELGTVQTAPAEVYDGPSITIGDAFVKSQAYAAIKERGTQGKWTSGSVELPFDATSGKALMKAAGGPILESGNTGVIAAMGDFRNVLEDPGLRQWPLTIADLLNTVQITVGNSVTYPKVTTRTPASGSGWVAENSEKLGVDAAFDVVTVTLQKLANYIKVSEEFLEDAPALAQYINNMLPLMIRQAEEAYLAIKLYGDADGWADGSTLQASPNGFDAVAEAVMTIRVAGFEPDGILIHPTDQATLQTTKDGVNGGYFSGGPYASPAQNPWGLRAVVTPSATAGSPLVGAFRAGATVYRKGGVSVEATNSNEDDFKHNLVMIRAEERLVEGTTYPEAFCGAVLPA